MEVTEEADPPEPVSSPAVPVERSKAPIQRFAIDIPPPTVDVDKVSIIPIAKNLASNNARSSIFLFLLRSEIDVRR